MRIDLELLQLMHTESLFFAGKNFGSKIKPGDKNITELYYDTDTGIVTVVCEGQTSLVKGFMSVTCRKEKQPVLEVVKPHTVVAVNAQIGGPNSPFQAQVSDPTQQAPKKPGRPAKYQGQESQGE